MTQEKIKKMSLLELKNIISKMLQDQQSLISSNCPNERELGNSGIFLCLLQKDIDASKDEIEFTLKDWFGNIINCEFKTELCFITNK